MRINPPAMRNVQMDEMQIEEIIEILGDAFDAEKDQNVKAEISRLIYLFPADIREPLWESSAKIRGMH